jgi:hypothetical protein
VAQVPERSDGPAEEITPRRPVGWAAPPRTVPLPDKPHATGRAGGGDGHSGWPPLLLLAAGVMVLALVVLRAPAALRAAPVLAYVMTVPGLACVRLARLSDRLAELAFGVGLSLALAVLVAQAMIYAKLWSPTLGIVILVVTASTAAAADLLTVRRPRRRLTPSGGGDR